MDYGAFNFQLLNPSQVTTKEDFNLVPYMGRWWELEKYPNMFQTGDCGFAHYALKDDATIAVNNTELRPDGTVYTAIGQVNALPPLVRC